MLPLQGVRVQFLLAKLRYCMPCGATKKLKNKKPKGNPVPNRSWLPTLFLSPGHHQLAFCLHAFLQGSSLAPCDIIQDAKRDWGSCKWGKEAWMGQEWWSLWYSREKGLSKEGIFTGHQLPHRNVVMGLPEPHRFLKIWNTSRSLLQSSPILNSDRNRHKSCGQNQIKHTCDLWPQLSVGLQVYHQVSPTSCYLSPFSQNVPGCAPCLSKLFAPWFPTGIMLTAPHQQHPPIFYPSFQIQYKSHLVHKLSWMTAHLGIYVLQLQGHLHLALGLCSQGVHTVLCSKYSPAYVWPTRTVCSDVTES